MDAIPMSDLEDRAREGMRLLDSHIPNWREMLNWDTLNMQDTNNCLLAQLFGDYTSGLYRLRLGYGSDHGFDLTCSTAYVENFDRLWRVWFNLASE